MATTTSQRQERASTAAEPSRPLLVNVNEAARMLAIGRTAVYRLVWNGDLTPIHIGKSVRFSVAQLEAFVADHEVG